MRKTYVVLMCCLMGLILSGSAYGLDPLGDPSLIGYWEFNEGEGDTVADSSGNGHDGTFIDSPVWVEGVYGSVLSFNTGLALVEIPSIDMVLSLELFNPTYWKRPALDVAKEGLAKMKQAVQRTL